MNACTTYALKNYSQMGPGGANDMYSVYGITTRGEATGKIEGFEPPPVL